MPSVRARQEVRASHSKQPPLAELSLTVLALEGVRADRPLNDHRIGRNPQWAPDLRLLFGLQPHDCHQCKRIASLRDARVHPVIEDHAPVFELIPKMDVTGTR